MSRGSILKLFLSAAPSWLPLEVGTWQMTMSPPGETWLPRYGPHTRTAASSLPEAAETSWRTDRRACVAAFPVPMLLDASSPSNSWMTNDLFAGLQPTQLQALPVAGLRCRDAGWKALAVWVL